MSRHPRTDGLADSPERSLPAVAAAAMVAWTALEFAFRRGLAPHLTDPLGSGVGAAALMLAGAVPLTAAVVAWLGTRAGVEPADWDYDLSLRTAAAGLGGVVAFLLVFDGITFVYTAVLGLERSLDASALGLGGAPTWALALFFVGNALVVPVAEELAWRGVIQTAIAESYGTPVAVGATALAFVAKHLVVDLAAPLFRVTSLLVLALVFCGLRARYGTTSSTVAHLVVNVLSTAPLVLAA